MTEQNRPDDAGEPPSITGHPADADAAAQLNGHILASAPARPEQPSRNFSSGYGGAANGNTNAGSNANSGNNFGWLRRLVGSGRDQSSLRDALEGLIEEEQTSGDGTPSIEGHERILISNVLKLRDLVVADVMVPRADINAIEISTDHRAILAHLASRPHSRLPVYRETLDDVVGFVHIKDVFAAIARDDQVALKDLVRKALVVAPSVPVMDLMLEMRSARVHMALVVDEYGGIDGLVTIEDLVEEIVGEIQDEHNMEVEPRLVRRADDVIIADARVSVEDFEEEVGTILEEEEREHIDTLGGLVFSLAGRVPARGELLRHSSGCEFEVLDADPRRVKRLRIRNLPASD